MGSGQRGRHTRGAGTDHDDVVLADNRLSRGGEGIDQA
jgi:hypothetical protein